MKHTERVVIPEKIETVVTKVTCDLCGRTIKERFVKDIYAVDDVVIEYRSGESYPDGSTGETTSVDMCGKCFNEKLIPWLKAQGAEPDVTEWDY